MSTVPFRIGNNTVRIPFFEADMPVKIRRTWGTLRPVTKVKPSAKIYNRKKK